MQCTRCGVVYRDEPFHGLPVRDPLTPETYARARRMKWLINQERFRGLRRHLRVSSGQAADIGTRDATLLRVLSDAGWEAVGYEPDARWQPYAAAQLGVTSRPEFFTTETTAPNSLDLVTALHILEHVPDPHVLLGAIHRALRPNGYLFVEMPNLRYIQRRQLVRGHVVLYTAHTLAQTVTAAGFVVRAVTECAPGGPRTYDQLGLLAQRCEQPATPQSWQIEAVDRTASAAITRAAAGRFHPWSSEWPKDRRSLTGLYRGVLRRIRIHSRRGRYLGWW